MDSATVQKENLKILIVDDFELPRRLIRTMLNDLGYEDHTNIFEADNGISALNVLQCNAINLIICDWVMPEMSGIDLLKTVRKTKGLSNIPFIMVTAETEKEHIMVAIKAGVSQYLIKPFTADAFYKKMQSALVCGK